MRQMLTPNEKTILSNNGFTQITDHGAIKLVGSEQIYGQDYVSVESNASSQGRFVVCNMCKKDTSESVVVGAPTYVNQMAEAVGEAKKRANKLMDFQMEAAEY